MSVVSRAKAGIARSLMRSIDASNLTDPADWFVAALMAASTPAAGIAVNSKNAVGVATVLGAGRVLSEAFAMTTSDVLSKADRSDATNYSIHALLHDAPNKHMTAFEFKEWQMWDMVFCGAAYAEKEIDRDGDVVALWPLLAINVRTHIIEGELWFEYPQAGGPPLMIPEARMFRCNGMVRGGLIGESIITQIRESISQAMAADRFSGKFFANGLHTGITLEHPGELGEKARKNLKEWAEENKGIDPAHRLTILEEGMKFVESMMEPQKAQMLETRQFLRTEVHAATRVPAHMLGDLQHATFSNVESIDVQFAKWVMDPWFVRWEQAANLRLMTEAERAKYYVKFNRATLLRGDRKSVYEAYRIGRQWGWLSGNDIRKAEDLNPQPGLDSYWAPMNMVPAELLEDFAKAKSGTRQSDLLPFARDAAARIARRVDADVAKGRELSEAVSGEWVADVLAPIVESRDGLEWLPGQVQNAIIQLHDRGDGWAESLTRQIENIVAMEGAAHA